LDEEVNGTGVDDDMYLKCPARVALISRRVALIIVNNVLCVGVARKSTIAVFICLDFSKGRRLYYQQGGQYG